MKTKIPNLIPIVLGGLVVVAGLVFIAYYGWLHTAGKPLSMMG